ncbi:MAG: hypothetical protein JKY37_15745 [Nannocystaceae bacterium]|nr:hypothetical protein [Nannocystaceae bacterium]
MSAILLWAAWMLPWRDWTAFAVVTMTVAAIHGVTALAFAAGLGVRGKLWRVQALAALSFQAWLTWNLVRSAVYVAEVYGSMGQGIAIGLVAVIAVLALLMVPTSVWALAATGGVRATRQGKVAAAAGTLLVTCGLVRADAAAQFTPLVTEDRAALTAMVTRAVHPIAGEPDPASPSLMSKQAVTCDTPVSDVGVTVIATFIGRNVAGTPEATTRCMQGPDVPGTLAALDDVLAQEARPGPIKLDIVTGVSALTPVLPVADALSMRPGLDGVCEGTRCLMPWQLFAIEAFTEMMPFPTVPDFRFGIDPVKLRAALVWPDSPLRPSASVEGLVRVSTASFVVDAQGVTHALRRLRVDGPDLTADAVADTMAAAEAYILDAQLPDGRFKYKLHPMTGQLTQHGFSLARQAGTSLVICELARDRPRAKQVATRAIEMLISTGLRSGDLMGLAYPVAKEHKHVRLGNTALASIALLSCRDLVGDTFDAEIGAMGRFLLAMQRADGGFNPKFSVEDGAPVPGADPLFAVGQAVYALSLLERLVATEDLPELPAVEVVNEAVERSMNYTANEFWQFFGRDFFWVEENWHCLAARASLQHHRHDGYERFCLEYATFKARLVLDEDSEVDRDYVGGVSIGNLTTPQTTATSGLSEAMAAAGAIARFRGEDSAVFERALTLTLPFVMHNQWRAESCFACTSEHTVLGAFSEHMASPQIRIDYVQHALASLGHGGRILGLVDGSSVPAARQ